MTLSFAIEMQPLHLMYLEALALHVKPMFPRPDFVIVLQIPVA